MTRRRLSARGGIEDPLPRVCVTIAQSPSLLGNLAEFACGLFRDFRFDYAQFPQVDWAAIGRDLGYPSRISAANFPALECEPQRLLAIGFLGI